MKITKLIEQLQKISDQYNGKVDVVLEYKVKDKIMITNRPRVYTKCIYYKEPKPIPNCRLAKSWEIHVVISNRVKLYNDFKAPIWGYKLWENRLLDYKVMKRYSNPEEYIRKLEESNGALRKELLKYKYIQDVNYELEEENKILKEALKWYIKRIDWRKAVKIVKWWIEIDLNI